MEIVFAGICCWVDTPSAQTGKTVILRNALEGGTHGGIPIPPHNAIIHAKRGDVDASHWMYDWAGGDDNLLFYLQGDYVTFDPPPSGGSIDLSLVPHVFDGAAADPICPAAQQIRDGILDEPAAENVLALVDIPADADVSSATNRNGAVFVSMTMLEAPVTIKATSFDNTAPPRALTIVNPDARVFIANVTISEYLSGSGAPDDSHRYLVCDLFKPASNKAFASARKGKKRATRRVTLHGDSTHTLALDRVSLMTLRRAGQRRMRDFLDTLASGCSDSQWP